MKDWPPSSNGAGVYVPPHQRLRSVVVRPSADDSAVSSDSKPRDGHGRSFSLPYNPRSTSAVAQFQAQRPSSQHISALDDAVSEEGSDRELDSLSHPVVGLSQCFLV